MATIALAAAGSAVGSAIGGTVLGVSAATIGQAAGAFGGNFIDSTLFAGKTRLPDVVGQRLETLSVQVSSYGKTIPHIYGYARIAGNVIWARDIREEEVRTTTTQSGGKGGGGSVSQTSVTYRYYATLAIAICEGEIEDVARVWADSKVLTNEELDASQGKYEIFYGTEDQLPSAIIERYQGAGEVPAYRGTAYVVIEDFPLERYGNRIPNFTFEVYRKVKFTPSVEEKIKAAMLIPGSGEFVYANEVVQRFEVVEDVNGALHQTGEKKQLNMHNFQNVPDISLAIDQLLETLPNLEYVGLVVSWFGTSKVCASCEIVPKVEYHEESATTTVPWSVAGIARNDAEIVLNFADGTPTYGGTPSDKSVIQAAQLLKARGLKVMFYPFLMIDTIDTMSGEDNKPWRGRIVPTSSSDVTTFFTRANGYNRFIRHYSQLSVDGVSLASLLDSFIIGSEMVGMTGFDAGGHTYPAVSAFKTLAANVKSDLGGSVPVSYAADWSEYHSTDGWFNLDPLWTDANIDFVGIDAYFPLTPDLPQSEITEAKIIEYWEKGEGWDYYYTDAVARTGLTNYSDPEYAWKNVEHWWNSAHENPDGNPTGWTAKLKPVWFTEYGFPSVDACANQPNVFYDPKSIESFFPRASRGRIDYQAQREAINATEDYLEARNATAGKEDLIPYRFIWTWDARPFPFYPDLQSVWADYNLYPTGHWVNGKLGASTLGAIVAQILARVGLSGSDYDVSRLTQSVDGFVIDSQTTARDALELLKVAYFFDMVESEGVLKFIPRGQSSIAEIDEQKLLPNGSGAVRSALEIARAQDLELPGKVSVSYINRPAGFQTVTQHAQRQTVSSTDHITVSFPIIMGDQYAKQIADISLYNAWISRTSFSLSLPPEFAQVEPADVITVSAGGVNHLMRVVSSNMDRTGAQQITAAAEDVASYDFYTPPGNAITEQGQGVLIPETELILLDLPPLPTDTGSDGVMRAAAVALGDSWTGAGIYRSIDGGVDGGNNFASITSTTAKAVKGFVLNQLDAWDGGNLFDMTNTLDVALISGTLASVSELALLNGANACVIGNEIIQFQNATLTAQGRYTLSKLLRGRQGTEHETANHVPGEPFILIDSALLEIPVAPANFGLQRFYKGVTFGAKVADVAEQAFTYTGKTLRPFSPVQITGARDGSGNLTLSWIRRTRISGEWRDGVDVPLGEQNEAYEVEILSGSTVVRTITGLAAATASYSAAEQTADFGTPQSSIDVRIYQLSAIFGRGVPGEATI